MKTNIQNIIVRPTYKQKTMHRHIKIISALLFLTTYAHAQEKNTIGTQEVDIVKSYTPTLSDAFKIQEAPVLNDSVITEKKAIDYTIFSVPVASTFVPATGGALQLAAVNKEKLYNSYISLELGNYTTAMLDFYAARPLDKDTSLDIALHHHSSQGGIKNVQLDDAFFNTAAGITYTKKSRASDWKISGGAQHQLYNWYGIYDYNAFDENTISTIDEQQNYYDAYLNAALTQRDSPLKEGDVTLRRFWDGMGSAEYHAVVKPTLEFPIAGELINIKTGVDYLNGKFNREFLSGASINYSSLIAGINPNLVILRDEIKVSLGALAVYALNPETGTNDFHIYPRVNASYNIVKNYVTAYGGVEGGLAQNTYRNFVAENQFVSPTLTIMPTDRQYNAFFGLKGKFTPNVGYHFKGNYSVENNKPLFLLNPVTNNPDEAYAYGNSYGIIYDDIKTFSILAALDVDVDRNINVGIRAEFFDYQAETQPEAWNLPAIKGTATANYKIGKNWSGSTSIFYIGERKDLLDVEGFIDPETINAESYADINTNITYRFNNRLSAFLKLNNILNNEYRRWATYPVQGFQVLAGASYQFNL